MLWIVVLIGIISAEAQKDSPCPDVFRYETKSVNISNPFSKQWIGIITLSAEDELQGIWLHISLDEPANLLINSFGHATTQNNKDFTITNAAYKLEEGLPVIIKLQVLYNPATEPPSLSKIRFNGRVICGLGVVQKTTTTPRSIISQVAQNITTERSNELETTITTFPRIKEDENTKLEYFSGDFNTLITEKKPSTPTSVLSNTIECGTIAKKGNWPWHIALYTSNGVQKRYICGGSLIGKRHVLTAAHCVTIPESSRPSNPDGFLIHLGRTNLKKSGNETQERLVDTISVHPRYNHSFYQGDLAVLRLSQDVDYTDYVRPVCLWSKGIGTKVTRKQGTVIGYFDQNNEISETLQETKMPVMNKLECIYSNPEFFSKYTTRTTFCAGFRNGTSVCNDDSGGGMLFIKNENAEDKVWEIRGLVSNSVKMQEIYCDPYNYVVFTDLAYYMDWIKDKLAE